MRTVLRAMKRGHWLVLLALVLPATAASAAVTKIAPEFRFRAENPVLTGEDIFWLLDEKSGCWLFNPLPVKGDKVTWSGLCQDKLASGQGTMMIYRGDAVYSIQTGVFTRGSLNGQGVSGSPQTEVYEGEFVYGTRHGRGTLKRANGEKYEGNWPGTGVYTLPDGTTCGAAMRRFGRIFAVWAPCRPEEKKEDRK